MMIPTCAKCDNPAKVHFADKPRCESCFTHYLQRTFKTSIGRLSAGGRRTIAIAISSGESSATAALLLHHYHTTLHPNPHTLAPHIVLIHILSSASSASTAAATATTPPPPPPSVTAVHAALPSATLVVSSLPAPTVASLSRVRDATDRTNLHMRALHTAVAHAAAQHACETVVLGTSASRAAVDVLHSLCTGRGSKVAHDASPDLVVDSVRFVRPLRHIPIRLLVRYARVVLPPDTTFTHSQLPAPADGAVSPRATALLPVVERFVSFVADDNSSSVHNVVRVAERLRGNEGPVCQLCGMPVVASSCASPSTHDDDDDEGDEDACDGCSCREILILCQACTACKRRANQSSSEINTNAENAILDVIASQNLASSELR